MIFRKCFLLSSSIALRHPWKETEERGPARRKAGPRFDVIEILRVAYKHESSVYLDGGL